MQKKFIGLLFLAGGLLMMAGGLVAQIAWLGFCFGTVIIGLVMLFLAPALLFLPFTFLMLSGIGLWGTGMSMITGDAGVKFEIGAAGAELRARRETARQEARIRREKAAAERARTKIQADPNDVSIWPTMVVLAVIAAMGFGLVKSSDPAPRQIARASTPAQAPPPIVLPEFAVASLSANVRATPDPKGKILRTMARGDVIRFASEQSGFVEIEAPGGERGYISRDLLIPAEEARKLSKMSAQEYVASQEKEDRSSLVNQQLAKQEASFIAAIEAIKIQSELVPKYLADLEAGKAIEIQPDSAAATWFGFAARHLIATGKPGEAYWDARAAVEADPSNEDHIVALALASYKTGTFSNVRVAAKMLPRLAPRSTNAWMILALSETLQQHPDVDSAKNALVLAVRLSKNPRVTRKYFTEVAESAANETTRQVFTEALEEERQRPDLFTGVLNKQP